MTVDGRTAQQQILECTEVAVDLQNQMRSVYASLQRELKKRGISVSSYKSLSVEKRSEMRENFHKNIFPLLTPLAIDPAHPFPFISNLSLNLLVTFKKEDLDEVVFTRIKMPVGSGLPRFLKVNDHNEFVCLSDYS